jgi:spermidine/putrescine transport system permease protein
VTGVDINTLPMKIYTQIKTGVTPKTNAMCALLFSATILLVILSDRWSQSKKDNPISSPKTLKKGDYL